MKLYIWEIDYWNNKKDVLLALAENANDARNKILTLFTNGEYADYDSVLENSETRDLYFFQALDKTPKVFDTLTAFIFEDIPNNGN